MNNLTFYLKNGIKLAANKRGEIFVTLNGYISLSGKPKQTISERTTRAFLAGTVFETPLKTEENGRMRLRNHKLIPLALACKWLEKDNPELAKAINGDLTGWLSQPQDLSQFHRKPKAVEVIAEITPVARNQNFSIELAQQLINSSEQFPVEFDEAWQWLGYTRKDSALKTLKSYFVDGEDFTLRQSAEWRQGGRSGDIYLLTTNCLKEFGMVAKTEQGKLIRKYFLECERIAKKAIVKPKPEPTPTPPMQLPPGDIRLDNLLKNLDRLGVDIKNPRINQDLQDWAMDALRTEGTATNSTQPTLPAPDTQKWYGVAERAEQLGYPVALVVKHRSQLGRFVAQHVGGGRKEDRLCNGTQRPINLYPASSELDAAIAAYLKNFY